MQAAKEILRSEGADALSLRAIAAAVGVSHMAPYTHFKNKRELLQAVAASGFDELAERMLIEKKPDLRRRDLILNYGVVYVQFAVENPEIYRLMLSQVDTGGRRNKGTKPESPAKVRVSEKLESSTQRPFKLLHAAFAKPGVDDKVVLARALGAWSMVHGMSALIIDGHLQIPKGMDVIDLFKIAVSP